MLFAGSVILMSTKHLQVPSAYIFKVSVINIAEADTLINCTPISFIKYLN